jgi:hypothetical protein
MHRILNSRKIASSDAARGIPPRGTRAAWANLCLATTLALCFSSVAAADVVSGRVYGEDGSPKASATFTATPVRKGQPVQFKSDASGNFSVYLDPGRHTITLSSDPTLEGTVDSYSQPVQQDIHLKKRGK